MFLLCKCACILLDGLIRRSSLPSWQVLMRTPNRHRVASLSSIEVIPSSVSNQRRVHLVVGLEHLGGRDAPFHDPVKAVVLG